MHYLDYYTEKLYIRVSRIEHQLEIETDPMVIEELQDELAPLVHELHYLQRMQREVPDEKI